MSDDRLDPERTAPGLLEVLRHLGDEYGSLGVAIVAAQMTDRDVLSQTLSQLNLSEEEAQPKPEPSRVCPDGGFCHHGCDAGCFRVRSAGPLTGVFAGDRWPARVVRTEALRDVAAAILEIEIPDMNLRNYGPIGAADWMRTKASEAALIEAGLLVSEEEDVD